MVTNFPLVGGAPWWIWLAPAVSAAAAVGTWAARVEAKTEARRPAAELTRPSAKPAAKAA